VLAGRVTLPTSVPPLFMYEGHRVDQDDVSLGFCRGALPIMVRVLAPIVDLRSLYFRLVDTC
jgi:hypothetical protein